MPIEKQWRTTFSSYAATSRTQAAIASIRKRLKECSFPADICHNGTVGFEIIHSINGDHSRFQLTLIHRLAYAPVSLDPLLFVFVHTNSSFISVQAKSRN